MRIYTRLIFLLLIILLSCSENSMDAPGYLIIDGVTYPITKAGFHHSLGGDLNYNGEMIFVQDILLMNRAGGEQRVDFSFAGYGEDVLKSGTYTYVSKGSDSYTYDPYDLWWATTSWNIDKPNPDGYICDEGVLEILAENDLYTIDFTGASDGHTVIVHYRGSVKMLYE